MESYNVFSITNSKITCVASEQLVILAGHCFARLFQLIVKRLHYIKSAQCLV